MAKIGDIHLIDGHGGFNSGAAFLLRKTSAESITIPIGREAAVEVSARNAYAVVRMVEGASPQEAHTSGLEYLQKALDVMSIAGKSDLATRDVLDEYAVWWKAGGECICRVVDTLTSEWAINIRISVGKDSSTSSERPEVKYHPAFRYFRLAQTTEDLFDAYRNMYLSFELLLSSISPKGREREIDWLDRSLRSLEVKLLPAELRNEVDPIQSVIDRVYKNARLPLFHAKQGRDFFEPHGHLTDREVIFQAFQALTELVLNIAREYCGVGRGMGARMFGGLKREMALSVFEKATLVVSDDSSTPDPHEADLKHPRFDSAVRMDTSVVPDMVQK